MHDDKINFSSIAAIALAHAESLVPQWLPGGRFEGEEWVVLNPTRADATLGSFKINTKDGKWADFATGDKGGDLISLRAYIDKISQQEAARTVAAKLGIKANSTAPATPKAPEYQPIIPVPDDAPPPAFNHFKLGPPSAKWVYYTADKKVLFWVCRFDNGEFGKKEILPLSYSATGWQWKGIPAPRPLYNLHLLAQHPDATVIVPEGEKAVDAAAQLLPLSDYVCVTSPNGSNAAKKADWGPLNGRRIFIWPDNDKAGEEYAKTVRALLPDSAVTVINPKMFGADLEAGWDAADALAEGWTMERVLAIIDPPKKETRQITMQEKPAWGAREEFAKLAVTGSKNTKFLNTIENVEALFRFLGITCRYNVISRKTDIIIPDKEFTLDNAENASYGHILSQMNLYGIPTSNLESYICCVADKNIYNPVLTWVESRAWDGKERIKELTDTIDAEDNAAKHWFIRRWLLQAMAYASQDRVDGAGVLVLQGRTGLGKSWWIRKLVPHEELPDVVRIGASVDPGNADSVSQVICRWIVELGELESTFKKADLGKLKAFITSEEDTFRRPYARKAEILPRRTALAASVEDKMYLHDNENRRFWTIPCKKIDSYHNVDMQQVWAEVLHLLRNGESYRMTDQERQMVKTINEDHKQIDPIMEKIQQKYYWAQTSRSNARTATMIAEELDIKPLNQGVTRQIAKALAEMGVDKKDTTIGGVKGKFFMMPEKMM